MVAHVMTQVLLHLSTGTTHYLDNYCKVQIIMTEVSPDAIQNLTKNTKASVNIRE